MIKERYSHWSDNAYPENLGTLGEAPVIGHHALKVITEFKRGSQMQRVQAA